MNRYEQVETGIYKYKSGDGEVVTYHERPKINGKRTYRSLGFNFTRQTSLKLARDEYHRRRVEISKGNNPYKEEKPEPKVEKATVSQIIKNYVAANYPDRYLKPRTGSTLTGETANCEKLLEYFDGEPWDSLTPPCWDEYYEWRISDVRKGCTGARSVDYEKVTLGNAFKYALRKSVVTFNPVKSFPRFQPKSDVHHCREYKPEDSEELHSIARLLFKKSRTESHGFQLLFEAYTGLRTEEVLMLRTDAKPGEPGYVADDGNMCVVRVKRGCNPFVFVHPGLKALMKAHKTWKMTRYPDSPWFFPGRYSDQPLDIGALSHALKRLRDKIGKKITSHGMRAFYVLVRRSQKTPDEIIAWELGHRTGGAVLITEVYGEIPQNWKNGAAPMLKWLPKKPAWKSLASKE